MKTGLFQCLDHCWVLQICSHIECSILTASSFRIWNVSVRILSFLLALFRVMLPKPHLTSTSGCLALGEWSHHHGYLLGAGKRHSTRDKGHGEGGLAYAKADRASGVPRDILEHLPPKTRVCLLYCFVLSPLTLLGAVPHHHLTVCQRVNLQLQLIKFLGN